jgi:uncharacterized protein YihD (DUF1040 family)
VDYVKFFNNIDSKRIPSWYKKELSLVLVDTFISWKEQADLKLEHYYLRMQINEEDIFDSQLMIIIEEEIINYKKRFISCDKVLECPTWMKDFPYDFKPFYSYSVWLEDELNSLEIAEKKTLLENVIEVKNVPSYDGNVYKEFLIQDGILWFLEYEK